MNTPTTGRSVLRQTGFLAAAAVALMAAGAHAAPGDVLATIDAPTSGGAGRFGSSVALQGAVIGVGESTFAPAGKAYSFRFRKKAPQITKEIDVSSPGATAFGYNVAFRGSTLYVGAPDVNTTGPGSGRAVAVSGKKKTIGTLLALFTVDGLNDGAGLGTGLRAIGGNVLLGAPAANDGGTSSAGKAFLINAKKKVVVAEVGSPSPKENAFFGYSVSNAGSKLVIGAPLDGATTFTGRVYVLRKKGKAYIPDFTIENPQPEENALFGYSVAGLGGRIVVGAPGATVTSETQAGKAFLFRSKSDKAGNPIQDAAINNPDPATGGNFGASVAFLSGKTVAIGAPGNGTTSETASGAVYFRNTKDGAPFANLPKFQNPAPADNAQLGFSVAGKGVRVVIGEPGRNGNDGVTHLISLK